MTFDQELLDWRWQPLDSERAGDATRADDAERVISIAAELANGFEALATVEKAVTVFGSARTPREHPHYRLVRETSARLGRAGYAVMTGGGPGLMEAANRGARDAGALSIGCNLEFPEREEPNEHLDLLLRFRHFFARKVMFLRYASAYVIAPGGYGTLDELFEALTLIQTRTVESCPVILLGAEEEWTELVRWLNSYPLAGGRIGERDLELLQVADGPERALEIVAGARTRSTG